MPSFCLSSFVELFRIELSLYTILQIFSLTLFEKKPILQVLTDTEYKNKITSPHMQLKLFES